MKTRALAVVLEIIGIECYGEYFPNSPYWSNKSSQAFPLLKEETIFGAQVSKKKIIVWRASVWVENPF